VLTSSLSIERVQYEENSNFWIGPRQVVALSELTCDQLLGLSLNCHRQKALADTPSCESYITLVATSAESQCKEEEKIQE